MTGTSSGDGRHVDPATGRLSGEAAPMKVESPETAWPLPVAKPSLPTQTRPAVAAQTPTYYDMPVIKPPPWKWYIPAYFHIGGTGGASAALGIAAGIAGGGRLEPLARKTRWIATACDAASAALLIADLGRPERFFNMLRVFRPTSPMNVGTWILSASGAASGLELAADVLGRRPRGFGLVKTASGAAGLALTSYTAVLLSNTAVPLWNGARRRLPILFGASSVAGAASLIDLLGTSSEAEARAVRAFGIAGKAAELASMDAVRRELGGGRASEPLRQGRSGAMWKGAAALGAASLALTLWPGTSRRRRRLAGALGTAGAAAVRFAVVEAGKASALDPRATFEPQRRGSP